MKFLFTLVISAFLLININGANMNIPIVPTPQILKINNQSFTLKKSIKIGISENVQDSSRYTAEIIGNTLKKYLGINSKIVRSSKVDIYLLKTTLKGNDNLKSDEAYTLEISGNGIVISGNTSKGIFYGAMSLIQLLEKATNNSLPGLKINDWPDLKMRGISDDISRGQVSTLDNFKRIIRFIARYKMNTYMPYMEDMFKFKKYPDIGKNRGALTKEEVKELVAYADKYFVQIIPIFQTLGHYENILTQDEFEKYAEFPGAASLNVSNDSTYIFLENMLKEVFAAFPSVYFHMGADESYDVGLGASKHLVDKYGIAKVHADHYKKVYEICKKYGKKVMMYGDILLKHPEILDQIPKDITIVDWHYRPDEDYESVKKIRGDGFNVIVSPSVWNFVNPFPNEENAILNIRQFTKSGIENGASGMINSNWGDFGAETFKELVLYGYAWSAQCAWNFKGSELNKFSNDYFYDFFGINDPRFAQIYEQLSQPSNMIYWNEVWRHPFSPLKIKAWEKSVLTTWGFDQLNNNISELEKIVKKNSDHFELLKFVVNLDYWVKEKLQTELAFRDTSGIRDSNEISKLKNMVNVNIASVKKLKKEYKPLWLKYYKPANLNMVMDKFDRMISYFSEIKDSLENGTIFYDPSIKSDWIYAKPKYGNLLTKAKFIKSFNLNSIPQKAYVQLMADTYARLFINGKYIDKVWARRSGSLLVDYKRVKMIDVKKYLKKGENQIAVIVENYNHNGAAGLNITSFIKNGDKIVNIDTHTDTWSATEIDSETKVNLTKKDYPWIVIAPNFNTLRPSWIER